MPLSDFQSRVLRLLAAHRTPESFVAGAAPLARGGSRFSHDIDLFHDRELAMQQAVEADAATLAGAGLRIEWTRRFPTICTAIIRDGDAGTLLEWLVDSAYRFFPAMPDELFGYVLHPADIATNKALAAAGRRGGGSLGILSICWISISGICRWARWRGQARPRTPVCRRRASSRRSGATAVTCRPIMTG